MPSLIHYYQVLSLIWWVVIHWTYIPSSISHFLATIGPRRNGLLNYLRLLSHTESISQLFFQPCTRRNLPKIIKLAVEFVAYFKFQWQISCKYAINYFLVRVLQYIYRFHALLYKLVYLIAPVLNFDQIEVLCKPRRGSAHK